MSGRELAHERRRCCTRSRRPRRDSPGGVVSTSGDFTSGRVGQAVHHDVEPLLAEVLPRSASVIPGWRSLPGPCSACSRGSRPAPPRACRTRRRADRSARTPAAVPSESRERLLHLSALESLVKMPERGRPAAHANGRTGLGERLGDGEPEAAVIRDAGDERALSGEVDREHAAESSR